MYNSSAVKSSKNKPQVYSNTIDKPGIGDLNYLEERFNIDNPDGSRVTNQSLVMSLNK